MSDIPNTPFKTKSFWKRPEGKTGLVFLIGLIFAVGYGFVLALPFLLSLVANTLSLILMLAAIGALLYVVLDPKMRSLVGYMYKSIMRFITGIFIRIDPIGILKSYIEDLKDNLKKMNRQIVALKGQMRKLKTLIEDNKRNIEANIKIASEAKKQDNKNVMILKSRKAGRLQKSNMKLDELYHRMEVLYRVITKMYNNSEFMLEDIEDQVQLKEQEYKVIKTSHSAMRSAMDIIRGNGSKKEMYDRALEAMSDDVSNRIGEMERFMEMSDNFMDSIDLQNGVFEQEGLDLLEKWEKEGVSLILGKEKDLLINDPAEVDLDAPIEKSGAKDSYGELFNFD